MNRKDRIKQVARLEEVVERYLPLKRGSSSGKTLTGFAPSMPTVIRRSV